MLKLSAGKRFLPEEQGTLLAPPLAILSDDGTEMINRYCIHNKQRSYGLPSSGRMITTLVWDKFVLEYPNSPAAKTLLLRSWLSLTGIRNHCVRPGFSEIDISPLKSFRRHDLNESFFEAVHECIYVNCLLSYGATNKAFPLNAPGNDYYTKELRDSVIGLYALMTSKHQVPVKMVPRPGIWISSEEEADVLDEPYRRLILKHTLYTRQSSNIWVLRDLENCAKGERRVY